MSLFHGIPVVRYAVVNGLTTVSSYSLFQGRPIRYAKDKAGHGSEKRGDAFTPQQRAGMEKRAKEMQAASQRREKDFAGTLNSLIDAAPQTRTSETERGARFGDSGKVFISHLFDAYREKEPGISRPEFNAMLLDAHHRGDVELSRADLVEAMHPEDVSESEVEHPSGMATFHLARPKKAKYSLYEGRPVRYAEFEESDHPREHGKFTKKEVSDALEEGLAEEPTEHWKHGERKLAGNLHKPKTEEEKLDKQRQKIRQRSESRAKEPQRKQKSEDQEKREQKNKAADEERRDHFRESIAQANTSHKAIEDTVAKVFAAYPEGTNALDYKTYVAFKKSLEDAWPGDENVGARPRAETKVAFIKVGKLAKDLAWQTQRVGKGKGREELKSAFDEITREATSAAWALHYAIADTPVRYHLYEGQRPQRYSLFEGRPVRYAEFEESEHPRDDSGKFTHTEGGSLDEASGWGNTEAPAATGWDDGGGWGDVGGEETDPESPDREGSRLNVLGEEGRVKFTDPMQDTSDADLAKIASTRKPLPLPPGGESLDPHVKKAWDTVSTLAPHMAGLVKKISVISEEQAKNWKGGRPTAAIDPENGHLVIGTSEGMTPGILWHELVHAEQGKRGDFNKSPRKNADGTLTSHGRLLESEAHQRGNIQGENLVKRFQQIRDKMQAKTNPARYSLFEGRPVR